MNLTKKNFEAERELLVKKIADFGNDGCSYRDLYQFGFCSYLSQYQLKKLIKASPEVKVDSIRCGESAWYNVFRVKNN
jgi:hypothetical protein